MRIITLLTDYGTRDYYVASLKGVILRIAPQVSIVDVTHDIEPHDVAQGAFVLRQVWAWYPPDTIHVAVVDPGVGSQRRILLGRYGGQYVIAPDNGLITWLHRDFGPEALQVVQNRDYFLPEVSSTFQGRDIIAPVAAHLANGVHPREFGPATDQVELLATLAPAEATATGWRGRVVYVDRYGNLVTNIAGERERPCAVLVGGALVGPLRATFADVETGRPVAYVGSAGFVEIAIREGNAAKQFGPTDSLVIEIQYSPTPR